MKFYSQKGEDAVILTAFPKGHTGFFIDVGALDGKRFSNTYALEERGWTGICVEAHPTYAALAKKNRPKSIVINAAASNRVKSPLRFTLIIEVRFPL